MKRSCAMQDLSSLHATSLTNCSMTCTRNSLVLGVDVGTKNLALCYMNRETKTVYNMQLMNILTQKSVLELDPVAEKKLVKKEKKATTYQLIDGLVKTLNAVHEHIPRDDVVCIIIENQPHFKLPTMKNIAVAIQTYYTMHTPSAHIQYMNGCTKYHLNHIKDDKKYKDRKKLSVVLCKESMNKYQDVHGMLQLSSYKKQDDLTDAYLLALAGCDMV